MQTYKTIYADPPWPIKWNASGGIGKKHIDYPTMAIAEICAIDVASIADRDCTLFMWTTNSFLPEALWVLRHWRFHYKMLFTWCKNNGMGGHPRNATEHMLIATRGEPESDRHAKATLNWLEHPRLRHSEKPEAFREIIERISPPPRVELFARKKVPGWDAWGNEVACDVNLAGKTEAREMEETK
jgi:N6-adenosine-specific RNA methylase IME4